MAESLNEPFDKTERRFPVQRVLKSGWTAIVIALVVGFAVFASILLAMSDTVTLSENQFVCTRPTATNRYRFDRPETCDQYTRRPEMTRKW